MPIIQSFDSVVSSVYGGIGFTAEGGIAKIMKNNSRDNLVKGNACVPSDNYHIDYVTIAPPNCFYPIGYVYAGLAMETTVSNGSYFWMVYSGVCQVLMEQNTTISNLQGFVYCSATAGQMTWSNDTGSTSTHFKEAGHPLEIKYDESNPFLLYCLIHFN